MHSLLVVLALIPACVVVPKQKTTIKVTDSGVSTPRPGKAGELALVASSKHADVLVETYRPRTCTSEHFEIYDVVAEKTASLEVPKGGGGSGEGAAIVLAASMFTLPISGIITSIIVATDDAEVSHGNRRVTQRSTSSCPLVTTNARIVATLPSGAELELAAGDDGRASFSVPDGEPDEGVVALQAERVGARDRAPTRRGRSAA